MGKVDRAVISLPAVNHMASKDRHKNSVSPVFAGEVYTRAFQLYRPLIDTISKISNES